MAGIVTGTDGSASASAAVRQAAELAASSDVPLHLVTGFPAGGTPGEAVARTLEGARAALADLDVAVELHAEPGGPAESLCAVAARVGAELIVVGNKGIDARLGRFRPAIAEQVRRLAPCPVLVIDTEPYWHAVEEADATCARPAPRPDPARVAGAARHHGRRLHGVPRRDDRQRRVPVDGGRLPRGLAERALVGPQRVQHRLRRGAGARRPDRGPAGPAADLLRRPVAVPRRLGPLRPRARLRVPDRGARRAGARRRGADPDLARAGPARVPARAARRGHERLGGGRRGGGGHRTVARRRAHRRGRLALGLLRQPDRRPGRAARAAAPGRPRGPGERRAPRRARRHPAGRRRRGGGAGHHQGARLGLDRRAGADLLARRRLRAGRAGRAGAAPSGAHPRAGAAADPLVHGGQRGDAAPLGRLLRAAAGERPVPHAGVGLLRAGGGLRRHARSAGRGGRGGHRRPDHRAARAARRAAPRDDRGGGRLPRLPRPAGARAAVRHALAARPAALGRGLRPRVRGAGHGHGDGAPAEPPGDGHRALLLRPPDRRRARDRDPRRGAGDARPGRAGRGVRRGVAADGGRALRLGDRRHAPAAGHGHGDRRGRSAAPPDGRGRDPGARAARARALRPPGRLPHGRGGPGDPPRARTAGLVADVAQARSRARPRSHGDRPRPARPRGVRRPGAGRLLARRARRDAARPARRARPRTRDGRRALARRRDRHELRLPLPRAGGAAGADLQRRARARRQRRPARDDPPRRGRGDAHARRAAAGGRGPRAGGDRWRR